MAQITAKFTDIETEKGRAVAGDFSLTGAMEIILEDGKKVLTSAVVMGLTLRWLWDTGGLQKIAVENEAAIIAAAEERAKKLNTPAQATQ